MVSGEPPAHRHTERDRAGETNEDYASSDGHLADSLRAHLRRSHYSQRSRLARREVYRRTVGGAPWNGDCSCAAMDREVTETLTSTLPERLDRLPWSRWHWRVVTALGI